MCIRDRRPVALRDGLLCTHIRGEGDSLVESVREVIGIAPVSYTHLDVYKRQVPHSAIDAEDGAITAVYDTLPAEEPGVRSVDAKGAYAAPGFIDIHLHGGGGVEFMDATPERIRAGCVAHARHGTTTLLPTTLAAVSYTHLVASSPSKLYN